jgi:hypothetical protein
LQLYGLGKQYRQWCFRRLQVFASKTDAAAQSDILKRIARLCTEGYFSPDIKRSLWRAMRREENATQALAAHQAYSSDDVQFAEWCMSVLLE